MEKIMGKEKLQNMNKMSPNSELAALREFSLQMPQSPELAII